MKTIVIFDIDGVIRDVSNSYRRAIADTVEKFTDNEYRPTMDDIDKLKTEGIWNNDWEASLELCRRYWQSRGEDRAILYNQLVDFFQSRYRGHGNNPDDWNGYITTEPLLVSQGYLDNLSRQEIGWGFFSGATRGSAEYILKKRLGLDNPILVAMEDAPGKPDPTGLIQAVSQIEKNYGTSELIPVIYVGDTVGDIYTVTKAKEKQPERLWRGVGIVPPHLHPKPEAHRQKLIEAGAYIVLDNVEQLIPENII